MTAGIVTTLLPTAAMAASPLDSSGTDVAFTMGFALDDPRSTTTLNAWGIVMTPNVTAPGGEGSPPTSGSVRLLALTILFVGGSGVLGDVASTGRDVAIYPSIAARSGSAVTDDAIGGVVSPWSSATSAGAAGTNTWVRYQFDGGTVTLDAATEYGIGLISGGTAFTNGTALRGAQSTGAGTFLVNSTPGRNTSWQMLVQASFAT